MPYSTFREAVSENYVSAVTLRGQDIEGTLNEDGREALEVPEPGEFVSVRPEVEDALVAATARHGAALDPDPRPAVLVLAPHGGADDEWGGAMNFGQSKAKKSKAKKSKARTAMSA